MSAVTRWLAKKHCTTGNLYLVLLRRRSLGGGLLKWAMVEHDVVVSTQSACALPMSYTVAQNLKRCRSALAWLYAAASA
jgi:hypothetical protein